MNAPLGRGAVVQTLREVGDTHPIGTIGLVTGQAKNGPDRYRVMFPGDPLEYSLAAKDVDLLREIDAQTWWRKTDNSASWINEARFAAFREALSYAQGHFSRAARAFAKINTEDAYWIYTTIRRGYEKQERNRAAELKINSAQGEQE